MRILHLITNPCLTHGGPVFEFEVSKRLKEDGIFFDYLITVPASPEDEMRFRQQGSELYLLPWDQKHGLLVRELKVSWAYYRFFRKHKYDIVYADTENPMRAIHLLMARFAGVKVRVIHSHNTGMQTTSRLSYKIARVVKKLFPLSATHYFACSDLAAEWLFTRDVFENKRYRVLKNGVDLNRFSFSTVSRKAIREKLGIPEDTLLLGHVGRFMPQKNHSFLLDVFVGVAARRNDARLMLIGDGALRSEAEKKARELGIADQVLFIGNVQNVNDYLHAMDMFIMPSLFEGLPVTGIEAQAAGLPCIFSETITRELGITDLAEYLPIDKGPDAWVERICRQNAAAPRRIMDEEIIRAGYSIDNTAAQLREFYLNNGGSAC